MAELAASENATIEEVDGATLEGGGQLLRVAVALGVGLGRDVRVKNIRAARSKPGLRPQHVASLRVAAAVGGVSVAGGIGGPVIGPFKVEKFDKKNPAAIAVDYALKILTMIVVGLAAVGSSDWHNPKFAVPVGLLCTGALLATCCAAVRLGLERQVSGRGSG